MEVYGYLAACGALLCFGSFNIPLKLDRTQKVHPDPMVFQVYMNFAVFCSSWLVLSYTPYTPPTYWGIVSAALWVFSSILSVFAINHAGLAVSQGIWSGCTIIVSFFWGSVIFKEEMVNVWLSILGLFLLVLAIAGISVAGSDLLTEARQDQILGEETLSFRDYEPHLQESNPPKNKLFGYICAASLAITNGSMLAPIRFAPPESQGIVFIFSFGIGVAAVTPLFAVIYFMILYHNKRRDWNPKVLFLPGFVGGLGWNIGNWASIYATGYLGYTVGFPLSQCALLVSGFWGIALFHEITGWKRILMYFVSSLLMVGGAVLLAFYGKK